MWPPPKKPKDRLFNWGNVISIGISLGSFIVSGAVAYVTVFRQVDEMRAIVDSMPAVVPHRNGLALVGPISLSFINSGTRTVSITRIYLVLVQPPKKTDVVEACGEQQQGSLAHAPGADLGDYYSSAYYQPTTADDKKRLADFERQMTNYEFNVEPFSIKPGEILYKGLEIKKDDLIKFTSENGPPEGKADLCLGLEIINAKEKLVSGLALTRNEWKFIGGENSDGAEGFASYYSGTGPFVILNSRYSFER